MKRLLTVTAVLFVALLCAGPAPAQTHACPFESVVGKDFDGAIVPNFYLEGNAIPVQKRNSVMLRCKCGKRLMFGLLDTSGYGVEVQQKYTGLVIVEVPIKLGTAQIPVGAYGLGIEKPAAGASAPARVFLYDVAGQKVGETTAQYDAALAQPMPLQVVTAPALKLYLGRYALEIK